MGRFRDPFLGGLKVLLASTVFPFILYPIWALVRETSWERLLGLLADHRFLMLENPYSPGSEAVRILPVVALGGVLGTSLYRASRMKGLWVGVLVGLLGGVGLFARGALATSLLVAGVVVPFPAPTRPRVA